MNLLNLSFRYKTPLWGSILIVAATLAISASLMNQAYDDLKSDLLNSSANLSRTLAKTLFPTMMHEEVWRAFEIIRAPLHNGPDGSMVQPEMIFALDNRQRVFVSGQPKSLPLSADIRQFGEEYARLADRIVASPEPDAAIIEFSGSRHIYVAVPVSEEGARLGTLVIVHSKDVFLARFKSVASRGAVIGLLVLTVLLPINWYWGQRIAVPLVQLARNIGSVAHGVPPELPLENYAYRDELGQLFEAYGLMVKTLQEKVLLEQGMIRSERLAAVGRLSAGIAHEINNPLGGMLIALDNFKRRGGHDERTLKTVDMIERGLSQIRDTVSAMLVEAKVKSREFTPQDVEDVDTLLSGEAYKRAVIIRITSDLAKPVALPTTLVRQILMNLLLNALQASEPSGTVYCSISHNAGKLVIETKNGGHAISEDVMSHLFEPFASGEKDGPGLGLWVTYQIVAQLGGQIAAESREGVTRFYVALPAGEIS